MSGRLVHRWLIGAIGRDPGSHPPIQSVATTGVQVSSTYLGVDDLKLPRAIRWLVLGCAYEGDKGCAKEHLDDACCALIIWCTRQLRLRTAPSGRETATYCWSGPFRTGRS